MRSKQLVEQGGLRTFALIFDDGDDPQTGLTEFAEERALSAASITAIGAFRRATVAYFDPDRSEYVDIAVDEQVEVLSLIGDIALVDASPAVHAHVVLGRRDGTTVGGHLRAANVFPTLEVIVTETPAHLHKTLDPSTGLLLIDLS